MQLQLASVDSGIVIVYRGHTILYVHIRAQVYHTFEFWHAHSWSELVKLFSYGLCLALT